MITEALLEIMPEHIYEGIRVLDIGVGAGMTLLASWFLGAGQIIGVESDGLTFDLMLTKTEASHIPLNIYLGEWERLNVTEPYDLAFCTVDDSDLLQNVIARVRCDKLILMYGYDNIRPVEGLINESDWEIVTRYEQVDKSILTVLER